MEIEALIYLWTRDAKYPVTQETEDYVLQHFSAAANNGPATYSDLERADMARRIMERVSDGVD